MTKNLTVGNPAQLILSFALPLIIGNLFQQFYAMADTFIVGRTLGVGALAAVGSTGSLNFFILGFIMGFTQGTSIITSQRFGAGDEAGVRRSFAASIILDILAALVMMIISVALTRPLLELLRTPADIIDQAYSYIVYIFAGIPAIVLFNMLSNVMRAVGDSHTPLVILVAACLINIALDFLFILVFKRGVQGAAYATVIAQLIAGLLCIPVILKKIPILHIRREDWKLDRAEFWVHIRVALPMGFQMSLIAIGALVVQFALNGLGTLAVAAFTAASKIDQIATLPMSSFGAAMTTYVAQNYGARKIDRIRKGLFQCLAISGSFSIVIGVLFFLFGHNLAAIFVEGDTTVTGLAHTYLMINGSCYIILAILFVCRQSLQGLGNSLVPTVAGIMELVMRMLAGIFLAQYFGFTGVCWASPLAWLGAAAPLFAAVLSNLKKLNREALAGRRPGAC
ncbi:MAG: MATE family efflux transporter [Treponema sp.]|jgi:putative MATE family efflux protein|nr:MATE family efflux transporter [Treponema sp.]